jgi:hypothetical protein
MVVKLLTELGMSSYEIGKNPARPGTWSNRQLKPPSRAFGKCQ